MNGEISFILRKIGRFKSTVSLEILFDEALRKLRINFESIRNYEIRIIYALFVDRTSFQYSARFYKKKLKRIEKMLPLSYNLIFKQN